MIRTSSMRRWLQAAVLITFLAFAIRAYNLGHDSFWLDEIFSVQAARMAAPRENDHPPLINYLIKGAILTFGENEWAARLPSLLAGTLAIPLLLRLGRQLRRPEGGLWAALLLALSPFHLGLSQEARHYALLMGLSLASWVALHRALARPRWPVWIGFALLSAANLYSHYMAFLVLATQAILIAGWLVWRRQWRTFVYPAVAALLVILLYLPWLPNLQRDLGRNLGVGATADSFGTGGIADWVGNALIEFSPPVPLLPYLLLGLALLGVGVLWRQRSWPALVFLAAGLVLPFALMVVFPISRSPVPRYVVYLLPLYLLLIGVSVAALVGQVGRRWPAQQGGWLLRPGLALALVALSGPLIGEQYEFVLEDWRGISRLLAERMGEDDVVLTMSLNFPLGDNVVYAALPYYLAKEGRANPVLYGNQLEAGQIAPLLASEGDSWAVVKNWGQPTRFNNGSSLEVIPFAFNLFVIHDRSPAGTALAQAIELYEQIEPLADRPSPQCLLRQDLAALSIGAQRYGAAGWSLAAALAQCPQLPSHAGLDWRPLLTEQVYAGLLAQLEANGLGEEASRLQAAWAVDGLTEGTLVAGLTAGDLLARYQAGEAEVNQNGAPEAVEVWAFVMPHRDDAGAVLFMHPPAEVTYPLLLPERPVSLRFRVAMSPLSWDWGGDGSTFVITIEPAGGEVVELYRYHVGNETAARDWHPADLSLADYAGQQVRLTLRTESGPAGDTTGDWAGWERPRLIWQIP